MHNPNISVGVCSPCVWTIAECRAAGRTLQGQLEILNKDEPFSPSGSLFLHLLHWTVRQMLSKFPSRFNDCCYSFLFSLSIAFPNVRWLSTTFTPSILVVGGWGGDFGLGRVWYSQIFLLIAYDFIVPLNVFRFFSLQIVSLLDSNFWALAAKIDSIFALLLIMDPYLDCSLLVLKNNYEWPRHNENSCLHNSAKQIIF